MNDSSHTNHSSIEFFDRSSNPDISVVIPTVPSSDHTRIIKKLSTQDFDWEYEIIVVNDSTVNACEARNIGLMTANAEIVAFTDDDCSPIDNWLSTIYEKFHKEDLICLEGQVTGSLNYTGSRGYLTSNLAVERSEALSVGGFRSKYSGWREDTEFGWRMERDGDGSCMYSDELIVEHPTRPRAEYNHEKEKLLRKEYPHRYNAVMNKSITNRLFRIVQRTGLFEKYKRIAYNDR
ncbi:glycosyltransferase family 2 protein [Haloterrigena salifodinae]|uniref:glycosyltransferase family 2 protein n=1 Tax=Haloterrigena salifodinae TaxID=2675099 RepID=UPI000F864A63|nr:glycosyltransferase family A protein [Haloterrigena salifodinae]